MDPFQVCCLGEKWRLSVGRSRGRARQNHREAMEEGQQRLLSAKNCSEEEAKEQRALLQGRSYGGSGVRTNPPPPPTGRRRSAKISFFFFFFLSGIAHESVIVEI